MLVGMKNALALMDDLNNHYDFAVNEECHDWDECDVSVNITEKYRTTYSRVKQTTQTCWV